MRHNRCPDGSKGSEHAALKIDKRSGRLTTISVRERQIIGKILSEGDDFKSMHRTDMIALQRLVDVKKFGISVVVYKDTRIKIGIKKKGSGIVVNRWRPI
jgi:hypothetical protein